MQQKRHDHAAAHYVDVPCVICFAASRVFPPPCRCSIILQMPYQYQRHVEPGAVTAVHDGFALEKSTVRAPLGGALMTRAMAASVARRGAVIRPRLSFRRVETAPGVWEVIRCSPHSARNGLSCADGQNLQLWNLDELGLRMTRFPVVGSASAAVRVE